MIVFTMFKAYADDDSMIDGYAIRQVPVYMSFHLQAYLSNPASTKTPVGESLARIRKVKRLPRNTGLMLPHKASITTLSPLHQAIDI